MMLRELLSEITPYRLRTMFGYYFPYVFMRGKAFVPKIVDLEVTYRCNLICPMCPQAEFFRDTSVKQWCSKRGPEFSDREIMDLLHHLKGAGIRGINLSGGEPFIRGDINTIIAKVKELGLSCYISTNGTLIDEEHVEVIVRNRVDEIWLSIDGNGKIHDQMRGVSGAYEKAFESLKRLSTSKKRIYSKLPLLIIKSIISPINYANIHMLVETACEGGADLLSVSRMFYVTKDVMEKAQGMFCDITNRKPLNMAIYDGFDKIDIGILKHSFKKMRGLAAKKNVNLDIQALLHERTIDMYMGENPRPYANKCFYPWIRTRIGPNGDVYPSSWDMYSMGNVRNDKFLNIWNGETDRKFRLTLKNRGLFPWCTSCNALDTKLWSLLPKVP